MKVKMDSAITKITAWVLAIALVIGIIPTTSFTADAAETVYGTVEAISQGITVSGDADVVAVNSEEITLNWVAADASIGRNEDGWWAGIKVTAPEGMTETELENAKYQRKNYDASEWSDSREFWKNKDSQADASEHYIGMWVCLTPDILKNAQTDGENVVTKWQFDWDNDSTFEQTITVSINPKKVVLLDETSTQAYPKLGSVETYNGGTVTGSETKKVSVIVDELTLNWSEADTTIGRNKDGWWAGIKVTAPEGMTETELENAKYQRKYYDADNWSDSREFWKNKDSQTGASEHYIGMWVCLTPDILRTAQTNGENIVTKWQFDWDNDSIFEQDITFEIIPSDKIVLVKENQAVLTFEDAPDTLTYSETQYTIKVAGGSGTGTVSYKIVEGTDVAEIDTNGKLTLKKAGSFTLEVSKLGDDTYNDAAAISKTIVVEPAEQTGFGFEKANPENIVYNENGNKYTNIATGGQSSASVQYEITAGSDVASVNTQTGELTISKAGTVKVKATKLADERYKETTAEYTITIDKAEQKIEFENGTDVGLIYGKQTYKNSAKEVAQAESADEKGYGTSNIVYQIVGKNGLEANLDASGVLTFKDGKIGTIKVKATKESDDCYNECSAEYTLTVSYLKTPQPSYRLSGDTKNESGWYTGDVTVSAPAGYQISYSNAITGNEWRDSVTYEEEGIHDVVVYLRDVDGGITDAITIKDLKIDKEAPKNLKISYVEPTWKKILNKIFFGIFGDDVTVTLTATDDISGISKLKYTYKNEKKTTTVEAKDLTFDEKTTTYKFTLKPQFRDTITFKVEDVAGHITDIVDKDAEGNEKTIVVDTEPPKLKVDYVFKNNGEYKNENNIIYTQDDVTVQFSIKEANFDLADQPIVTVNETPVTVTWAQDTETGLWLGEHTLSAEGDYVVEASFTDARELSATAYKQEIRVDRTAPTIKVEPDVREKTYYGGPKTFVITIEEHNFDLAKVVPFITVTNVLDGVEVKDYTNYLTKAENWSHSGDTHEVTVKFEEDATYQITLDCQDLSGRDAAQYNSAEFVVDNVDPVISVEFEPSISTSGKYYKEARIATITIEEHNFKPEYVETLVNVNRALDESKIPEYKEILSNPDSWNEKGDDVYTASIPFTEDADYQLTLDCTDLSGRTAEQYSSEEFVIDNVDPVITVTYDNNEVANDKYYKVARIATVQIVEHNFNPEAVKVVVEATRKLDENAKIDDCTSISWDRKGDDVYTASIPFTEDADYLFTVDCTDLALREAKQYETEFVIDNVDPTIEISYKNKEVVNTIEGRDYLAAQQEAEIVIKEHNFDAKYVNVIVKAVDSADNEIVVKDGQDKLTKYYNDLFRDINSWNQKAGEDVYTATVKFEQDANYTFDIEFVDLADRSIKDQEEKLFTVDTVAPKQLAAEYSTSVYETTNGTTQYGYYNGQVEVTISGEDATSGIYSFLYSYINNIGVSKVNAELIDAIIEKAKITQELGTHKFTAMFTIPKEALSANNQFNGTIEFTAFDASGNSTERVEKKQIIVDNISPTVQVTLNEPVKTVNNQSYYDGNIEGTIVIQEANFFAQEVEVIVTRDGASQAMHVNWVDNSVDTHTGTFTLTEDGDYFITFRYADRSKNRMAEYASNELTIDTKHPTIHASNIVMNSANKDEVYGFTVSVDDVNFDASTFKPVLTAIVRSEDGVYTTKEITLGDMQTVEDGKAYSYTVGNLEEDGIYSLRCDVKDMSNNAYSQITLSDGREYEVVQFSINRHGSTFMVDGNTKGVVDKYYVYSVNNDVVITEINADPIENYVVKVNGKVLKNSEYNTEMTSNTGEWYKRTYTIKKSLFEKEGEYSIVVESTDKANTTAYSDVKGLKIAFVVDQTKPVLTISGLENSGRYQVEEQVVTVIPTDDGGRLYSFKAIVYDNDGNPLKDKNGKDISIRFEMEGEELLKYLEEHDGKITFTVPEGYQNNVQIICTDCAMNSEGMTNAFDETFEKVTVSASQIVIFYANKPLFYGTVAVLLAVIGGIVLFAYKKRKKVEE